MEQIRNSALRGLLGGGIGIFLAILVTYWGQIDVKVFSVFIAVYDILPGAVAGFLLVLSVDVALASYDGRRRWMIWPAGALAGAISFTLMLLAHVAFTKVSQNPLAIFGVILEGTLWGAAAGLSAVLATGTRRPLWQSIWGRFRPPRSSLCFPRRTRLRRNPFPSSQALPSPRF